MRCGSSRSNTLSVDGSSLRRIGRISCYTFLIGLGTIFSIPSTNPANQTEASSTKAALAVSDTGDGRRLYLISDKDTLKLHHGIVGTDSDLDFSGGVSLADWSRGMQGTDQVAPPVGMVLNSNNTLFLGSSQDGKAYVLTYSVTEPSKRLINRDFHRHELGPGNPTSVVMNPNTGWPVLAGVAVENGCTTIWVSHGFQSGWSYEKIIGDQHSTWPQISVSHLGIVHVVWRDTSGKVWHLQSNENGNWSTSANTSSKPELIGFAVADPAITCFRHQVLVILPSEKGHFRYSVYTGQSWEKNLLLTEADASLAGNRFSTARLVIDGRNVPWVLFVNDTVWSAYHTRWLGFDWDAIREIPATKRQDEKRQKNSASLKNLYVPTHIPSGSEEFVILMEHHNIDHPLVLRRLHMPTPIAAAGVEIFFEDMLNVSQALWTEQVVPKELGTTNSTNRKYLRNTEGHHVGYITTLPIKVEDLKKCVLVVNARADKDNYLIAELLHSTSDDRIEGYEHENCDKIVTSGESQVITWRGNAGLDGVQVDAIRVRILLCGRSDSLRLVSVGFRKQEASEPPPIFQPETGLVEKPLVYASSVSSIETLKAWIAYRPDGKPKPVLVVMHGYGDPVYRHGGRRMLGSVRHYAGRGLFALAVDLRGREESGGQRDDGGLEVLDIYDAVQQALRRYPAETDSSNINIIGWSGGGGNTFSAVTRLPDLFSTAAAFFGITDYEYWANTTWMENLRPNVGGTPAEVPDRYMARNSLLGVINNAYTHFQFFWDEEEKLCPPWMDIEYRRIAHELGYTNITAHESKKTDRFRWLHEGMDKASSGEAARLVEPLFLMNANPNPQIKDEGKLMVLGYLFTKRFQALFGQGNDAVTELDYKFSPNAYRFTFALKSSDPGALGWLRITDRKPKEVAEVRQDDEPHAWEIGIADSILIRDIRPNATVAVRFK